jgi:acetylornithine deacetylase
MTQSPVDVVALTLELCALPSPTGDESAVMALAASWCQRLGLSVSTQPVGQGGRCNVLATDPDTPPQVLFTTHLDTVPPHIPPTDDGDLLRGRGTCDAKGAAAAMLVAVERLRAAGERRVGLLFVVGEETESDGAKAAAAGFAPGVRYVVNGEPTALQLASGQKGTLVFELEAAGTACHSAYPELGHSAVHDLCVAVTDLLAEPWPTADMGETTLNVGTFHGGVATNVLAPHATARGIFRLTVPAREVEERARVLLSDAVTFRRVTSTEPTRLHVPPGFPSAVVRFGSDVPHLSSLGTALMAGPGSIHDAHTDHEHVRKTDLHAAVDLYVRLARTLLS